MNNEMIVINNENNKQTVLGRDLHRFLEVGTDYDKWFPRMCEYGFIEDLDFSTFLEESSGGRKPTNHQITISMAKEISMLQRTEKGKEARKYFIRCEEQLKNQKPKELSRMEILQIAIESEKEVLRLEAENKVKDEIILLNQPKVDAYQHLIKSDAVMDLDVAAKVLGYKGLGRNNLIKLLVSREIFYKKQNGSKETNCVYQTYVDKGFFKVTINSITINGVDRATESIKVTTKGLDSLRRWLDKKGYERLN